VEFYLRREELEEIMQRNGIQRRTVYGVTLVAILAIAGGFAIADTFSFQQTSLQGQNGYSIQTGATMWKFVSANDTVEPVSPCTTIPPALTILTPGTSPGNAQAYIPAASGGTCLDTDFAEEFNFTGSVVTSPTSDTFTVFSYTNESAETCSSAPQVAAANYVTVATVGGTSTPTTIEFNFWVDFGPAPVDLCGVSIAVAGS